MKRFENHYLFKLLSAKIDLKRKDPQPFPGMFPTRWAIVFVRQRAMWNQLNVGKTKFRYVGKPNVKVAQQVKRDAGRYEGMLYLHEFDRGGMIREYSIHTPVGRLNGVQTLLENFYYMHHPATFPDFFSPWLDAPVFRKLLTWNKKKFVRYSPEQVIPTIAFKGMKDWLDLAKYDLR